MPTLPNGAVRAATRIAGQIGGFLVTRGVIRPRSFAPFLEHMAAPVEEFAVFMAGVLAAGVSAPLVQAGREVGREFLAEAIAGALDAARPRPPRATSDLPENPLSDDQRRSLGAFRAEL